MGFDENSPINSTIHQRLSRILSSCAPNSRQRDQLRFHIQGDKGVPK